MMGAGVIALTGDLPGTMGYIKSCGPLLTVPLKGLIAFPIVYHYVAGATLTVEDFYLFRYHHGPIMFVFPNSNYWFRC